MVGDYEVDRVLGRGGAGIVWLARHRSTDVQVAIKFVNQSGNQAELPDSYLNEVQAIAGLNHPGIVRVIDAGVVESSVDIPGVETGAPYLVSEYVSGGTLHPYSGRLPWSVVKSVLISVLEGLAHAHGIIHRDLKPSNILVDDTLGGFSPKIVDFGIARLDETNEDVFKTVEGNVIGTPKYMAPEQIRGEQREQGPATDMYALGCIAFALLTGKPPFVADSTYEILRQHLFEPIPSLTAVGATRELEDWLRLMLAKDHFNRFECAADAAWMLARVPYQEIQTLAVPSDTDMTALDLTETSTPLHQRSSTRHVVRGYETGPAPIDWRDHRDVRAFALRGAGLGTLRWRSVQFIGSESQRDALWENLLRVNESGRPRMTLIEGGPGEGKTRLARWLLERGEELGVCRTLRIRLGAGGGFESVGRAVAEYYGCVGATSEYAIDRLRGAFEAQGIVDAISVSYAMVLVAAMPLRDDLTLRNVNPTVLGDSMIRVLEMMASDRPLAVLVDDIHHGHELQAHFERALSKPELPVYFVATTRDVATIDGPNVDTIRIAGLKATEHLELVQSLIGLNPEVAEDIVERTDGNPLFAVQVIDDWVNRGLLIAEADGLEVHGDLPPIPDEIHEVWVSRLEHTLGGSPSTWSALKLASLFEPQVSNSEWARACESVGIPCDHQQLSQLVVAGLVAKIGQQEWAFEHQMLRESLQRLIPNDEFAQYHQACATAIESARDDSDLERIASHYHHARQWRLASLRYPCAPTHASHVAIPPQP